MKVVDTFIQHDVTHDSILAAGVGTNLAVGISALSAFPWVRNTHHKYVFTKYHKSFNKKLTPPFSVFERHHRFVGWVGIIFTLVSLYAS